MDYIAGPIYTPDSSWVDGFAHGFYEGELGLFISFKGTLIFYPDQDEKVFFGLHRAKSKGEWVHDNIYNAPYVIAGESL